MFSQENMGTIQEMGTAEKEGKVGDGVVMPFNVTCGLCKNCLGGFTGFCTTVAPGFAGGALGTSRRAMGWGPGRTPPGSVRRLHCLPLSEGTEHEGDFGMLADIFSMSRSQRQAMMDRDDNQLALANSNRSIILGANYL